MIKTRNNFLKTYKKPKYTPNDTIEVFDFVKNEKGELTIAKTGEYSQKEYVNSFKEESTLANQIANMKTTGNIAFLSAKKPTYADITEIDNLMTLDKKEFKTKTEELNKKLKELEAQLNELNNPKEETDNVKDK